MNFSVDICDKINILELEMLLSDTTSFPQYSLEWINIILHLFPANVYFITVRSEGKLIGFQPVIIKQCGCFTFANSLPFSGSYGCLLLSDSIKSENKIDIYRNVLNKVDELCKLEKVDSLTIVGNPIIVGEKKIIDAVWNYTKYFPKINQMNDLCKPLQFKKTVQWSIDKAVKEGVQISFDYNSKHLQNFYELYKINRKKYNALAYDISYFDKIYYTMAIKNKADIVFAFKNDIMLGGLVVIKGNNVVCYQEPVIDQQYKTYQAGSLMIYTLMQKCKEEGYMYWSWGASPDRECGVFKFKESWGPEIFEYGLYIKHYTPIDTLIKRGLNYETLTRDFRIYYVVDFALIKTDI